MAAISGDIFKDIFLIYIVYLYIDSNIAEICSQWLGWQYSNTGLNNGVTSNRQQAIFWTNVGLVYWRPYVSVMNWIILPQCGAVITRSIL